MKSIYNDIRSSDEIHRDDHLLDEATKLNELAMMKPRLDLQHVLETAGMCSLFGNYSLLEGAVEHVKEELDHHRILRQYDSLK